MAPRRDFMQAQDISPGPGAYLATDVEREARNLGNNKGFSTASRDQQFVKKAAGKEPGPGSYDEGSGIGKGAAYSISPRYKRKGEDDAKYTPGPATYGDGNMVLKGPKYSIRPRRLDVTNKKIQMPGPGAYEPSVFNIGYKTAKKAGGSSFGASSRASPTPRDSKYTPGPGSYLAGTAR